MVAGTVSLSFGVVGLFLPIWPTTPFLLLSSYCYLRGSSRMYDWLNNHPLLGNYIRNYLVRGGITRRDRNVALAFLWVTLGASMYLSASLHLRVFLALVGAAVSVHLVRLRSLD